MKLLIVFLTLFATSCSNEKKTNPEGKVATSISATAAAKKLPLQFPRDEGVHNDQPIEWWYLNSQFTNAVGKQYAFFFCEFSTGRHLLSLYDKSADTNLVKDFYEGVTAEENKLGLSSLTGKWRQTNAPFNYTFTYDFEGIALELELKSNKKPFLPNGDGFVDMGQNGTSCYYALTDLSLTGTLKLGTNQVPISGKAWMDHQWGKWDWATAFTQWKWYSVQLDNGVELMLFNIYKDKTLLNSHCGYIDKDNNQFHRLPCQLVTRQVYTDAFGGKWQKEVDLQIPSLSNTKLTLTSERDLQFIEPRVLWEGSMKVAGSFKGVLVKGTAYQELNRPD
jgi:predicted secreted hydrolase